MNKRIYTVSIINMLDGAAAVWNSAFSTENKAVCFKEKAEGWIEDNGYLGILKVDMDACTLDDESYMEMLEEEYGE